MSDHCFNVSSVILNANVSWNSSILLFILLHLVGLLREASSRAANPPYTHTHPPSHHPLHGGARAREETIAANHVAGRGCGHAPCTGFHVAGWSESSKAWLNATELTGNIFTTGTKEEGPGNPADFQDLWDGGAASHRRSASKHICHHGFCGFTLGSSQH